MLYQGIISKKNIEPHDVKFVLYKDMELGL